MHLFCRESKLTRLLKDSLGGRTKTCIIATVSMAKMNQEEIVSTLDYPSRAKNICNRPEANQRMNPRVLFREYETLIERLKQDLQATRAQKGVYLSQQTYDLMADESQSAKDRVGELTKDVEKLHGTLQEHVKTLEEKTALLSHAQSTLSLATVCRLSFAFDEYTDTQSIGESKVTRQDAGETDIRIPKSSS